MNKHLHRNVNSGGIETGRGIKQPNIFSRLHAKRGPAHSSTS